MYRSLNRILREPVSIITNRYFNEPQNYRERAAAMRHPIYVQPCYSRMIHAQEGTTALLNYAAVPSMRRMSVDYGQVLVIRFAT